MANKPKGAAVDNDVEDVDDNPQTPAAPAAPVQTALNQMTQQGQNLQNKLNQTIQNNSQLTSQQKANADALKSGKPLPQQPVNPNDI
jgi:hypothetical protein